MAAVDWRRIALGLASLAVLGRVVIISAFPALRVPYTYEPEVITENILAGRGFLFPHFGLEYRAVRPLFVYLCVAVYWLTDHSHVAVLAVQAVLSGLTVFTGFLIGRHLAGPATAGLAVSFTAVEPALWYYDVTRIHPLGLEALLLCLVVLSFLWLSVTPHWTAFLLAGAAAGAAIYQRGPVIFFLPAGLILVGYWHRLGFFHWIRGIILFGLGSLLILSPWLVRTYTVYGRPVISTAVPELFWVGNNPNATGSAVTASGQTMLDAAPDAFRSRILSAPDEETQQRLFRDELVRFVTSHPWQAFTLFVKKVYYFWWFTPQAGREHPPWALSVYKPLYFWALLAAVWGAVVGLRGIRQRQFVLLLLFLLTVSMGQSLFYVEGRHRLALMPLLLHPAAVGVLDLVSRARRFA